MTISDSSREIILHSRTQGFQRRFLLLALVAVCLPAMGQENGEPEAPGIVADKFNRGTPSGTAQGFFAAVDIGDYEAAAEYLDLRNLRGAATELTGPQLARHLA